MARKFSELKNALEKNMTPDERVAHAKRVAKMIEEVRLGQMRRGRELTQVALAQRLGIDQGAVSRIEKQTDMHLSTLRSYVEAAGGRLELRAVFPEQTMTLEVSE